MIGISSGELEYRELRDYVHQFEKKLLEVDGVAEVSLSGYQDREVRIEVSPDKLMKYGLSLSQVSQAIAARNIRSSGGVIEMETDHKNVITLAKFSQPEDVGNVMLKSYSNGAVIRVSDVATISDTFTDASSLQRINGQPTISARLTKSASADIIRTTDAVKALIAAEEASLQSEMIQFTITEDDSVAVRDKFNIVKTNGVIGLIMVFVVLAIFLVLLLFLIQIVSIVRCAPY
jgi:multidrug efflux pump subunit AcrB